MEFKSIEEIGIEGKKLFLRVDFNVPLDKKGAVTDDTRIRAVLPTLNYALSKKAKVILASHLGRPKGQPDPQYSLAPVARKLSELLKKDVKLAPDCIGPEVEKMAAELKPGDILLLENLRFHKGEEKNDPEFAQSLARLAEVYVNDAFAVSHRAHASVEGMTKFFKEKAAGLFDEAGAALPRPGDGKPHSPPGSGNRRGEGFRKAGGPPESHSSCRQTDYRRRDGFYFSEIQGDRRRQIAGRRRPPQNRPGDPGVG